MTVQTESLRDSQTENGTAAAASGERQRRPNPLNIAYDKKRSEIDDRISVLQKRLDVLKTGGSDDSASSMRNERGRVIGQLKELRDKMKNARDDANSDMKQLKDIQNSIKKHKDDIKEQKEKLPYKSIPEIDSRISALEGQIETGSFSLTEERQLLQDISRLKKSKKTLEMLEFGGSADGRSSSSSSSDVGNLKMREELYRSRMTAKFAEVDELKKQIEAADAELVKLDGGKEAAQQKQKARNAEIDRLKKEIDAEYDSRRKLLDEHRQAKQKQREAWERNQAKREEEEKRAKIEEQIEQLENKLRHLNPSHSINLKIEECVNLSNYFSSLATNASGSNSSSAPSAVASDSKCAPQVLDGEFVVLTPKSGRDQVFCQVGSTKSKKSSSSSQPTSQLGKLPIHIISGLADLQLPLPTSIASIPALMDSLGQKKTVFESSREEAMASVKDEEAAVKNQISALQAQL